MPRASKIATKNLLPSNTSRDQSPAPKPWESRKAVRFGSDTSPGISINASRMRSPAVPSKPRQRKKSMRFGIPIFPGLPQASSLLKIPLPGALPKLSKRMTSFNNLPSAIQSVNVSDSEESEL